MPLIDVFLNCAKDDRNFLEDISGLVILNLVVYSLYYLIDTETQTGGCPDYAAYVNADEAVLASLSKLLFSLDSVMLTITS